MTPRMATRRKPKTRTERLTFEELFAHALCDKPGCSEVHRSFLLRAKCHRAVGVVIHVIPRKRMMMVSCAACHKPVVDLVL